MGVYGGVYSGLMSGSMTRSGAQYGGMFCMLLFTWVSSPGTYGVSAMSVSISSMLFRARVARGLGSSLVRGCTSIFLPPPVRFGFNLGLGIGVKGLGGVVCGTTFRFRFWVLIFRLSERFR